MGNLNISFNHTKLSIAVENPVVPLKKVRTGTTLHPNPVPTLNTKVQPHSNNDKKGYQTKMVLKVNGSTTKGSRHRFYHTHK